MKLNMNIIFDNLKPVISAELTGMRGKTLSLGRPEYYMDSGKAFREGHLYVVKAEKLPQRIMAEKGAGIVCIGENVFLPYYREKCGIIQIRENVDCLYVLNLLTEVYNRYDEWCDELNRIIHTSASLPEMIKVSQPIFKNPIFVLNSNFHFLAYSDELEADLMEWEEREEKRALPLSDFGRFLELREMSTQTREPILLRLLDTCTLNVNLFDNGEYCGCVSIDYRNEEYREGDDALAEFLARMLEFALQKYSIADTDEKSALRHAIRDMLDGLQMSLNQRRVIDTAQLGCEYTCMKLWFGSRLIQLPMAYLCSMIELNFPGSVAFEYDGAVVAFLHADSMKREALESQVLPLIHFRDLDVGISDSFHDIYKARLYYLQTCAALENGRLFDPEQHYYFFQDYALTELIINAIGRLPMEMYYPEGLRRLFRHDSGSSVSYVDTLRTYLEKNMSITRTTESLYINRSTLLERISRIKRELNTDLQDPDERLRLLILLKAVQLNAILQKKPPQP